MKTMSEREFIRGVIADRLKSPDFEGKPHPDKLAVMALDPETMTLAELRAATTVFGVIPSFCTECNTETWDTVHMDAEADNEPATARICWECLVKAGDLLCPDPMIELPPETISAMRASVENGLPAPPVNADGTLADPEKFGTLTIDCKPVLSEFSETPIKLGDIAPGFVTQKDADGLMRAMLTDAGL